MVSHVNVGRETKGTGYYYSSKLITRKGFVRIVLYTALFSLTFRCFTYYLDALKEFNVYLVGPYDILSGKKFKTTENSSSLCLHYRYFCDPPEFVTVLKGDDSVGLHIGYYR